MSATGDSSYLPQPVGQGPGARADGRGRWAGGPLAALVIIVASVLVGAAGGLVWILLAPRADYVVVTHGSADVINPETSAFIAADVAYCAIGVIGGLIIGLAGYLLAVRRYGPWPMAAILVGSTTAGMVARWLGEHSGLSEFNNHLLNSPIGTHLQAPLALAGDTSARTWPTMASLPDLAFWPLAACAVSGGLVLMTVLRERSERTRYATGYPGTQPSGTLPG